MMDAVDNWNIDQDHEFVDLVQIFFKTMKKTSDQNGGVAPKLEKIKSHIMFNETCFNNVKE